MRTKLYVRYDDDLPDTIKGCTVATNDSYIVIMNPASGPEIKMRCIQRAVSNIDRLKLDKQYPCGTLKYSINNL